MRALCRDLGTMEYEACWQLQQELFDALVARKVAQGKAIRPAGSAAAERANLLAENAAAERANRAGGADSAAADSDVAGTILLVEHPPVYTLGKSGHEENLLIDEQALARLGARFYRIDRGGDITFHGPGQLVCYPILDLERLGIGLRRYIEALEGAVIDAVARYGIRAGRMAGASGVWIEEKGRAPRKICAIGVRSSRYVTMHGFALNVATDLGWFDRINPCGFRDRGATSVARETGCTIPMEQVKAAVLERLSEQLNVKIYNK